MVLICPCEEGDLWEKVEFHEKMLCSTQFHVRVQVSRAAQRRAGRMFDAHRGSMCVCSMEGSMRVCSMHGRIIQCTAV